MLGSSDETKLGYRGEMWAYLRLPSKARHNFLFYTSHND